MEAKREISIEEWLKLPSHSHGDSRLPLLFEFGKFAAPTEGKPEREVK